MDRLNSNYSERLLYQMVGSIFSIDRNAHSNTLNRNMQQSNYDHEARNTDDNESEFRSVPK